MEGYNIISLHLVYLHYIMFYTILKENMTIHFMPGIWYSFYTYVQNHFYYTYYPPTL